MRWRGFLALGLAVSGCAQVVGLSDFEIVPDDAAVPVAPDASTGSDGSRPSADASVADATSPVDSGRDGGALLPPDGADRHGVQCSASLTCTDPSLPCCLTQTDAVYSYACTQMAPCLANDQGSTRSFFFACDDHVDCPTDQVCCLTLNASELAKAGACASTCALSSTQNIACIEDSECPPGTHCTRADVLPNNLPLLKICQ